MQAPQEEGGRNSTSMKRGPGVRPALRGVIKRTEPSFSPGPLVVNLGFVPGLCLSDPVFNSSCRESGGISVPLLECQAALAGVNFKFTPG